MFMVCLWYVCGMLNFDTFVEARRSVDRMKTTLFGTIDSYLDVNCHSCEKTGPICLALVGLMAGWQTKC